MPPPPPISTPDQSSAASAVYKRQILSEGILPGSIQIPSNGQPIVLLRDIPCTGGYPKIALLDSEDISKISQLPPGSKITFDL